jgi:hypothetical protein
MQCRSRVINVNFVTLCQSQQYYFFSLFDMFENKSTQYYNAIIVITSNCLDNIIFRQRIDMLAIYQPDIKVYALCVHWMNIQLSHKPILLIGAMWW